ncbi:MAG: hypothetical protein WAU58_11160 [Terriglobales bacterium]
MKREYAEGPQVAAKFEEAMKILFQTPKLKEEKTKPGTLRKTGKTDKD